MSYTDPSREDMIEMIEAERKRQRPYFKWVALAIAVLLIVVFMLEKPFVNPKIKAEAYVWPQGCEERKYKNQDEIPPECENDRYYIGNGREFGWSRAPGGYYRVGNDAVQVVCLFYDQSSCTVNRIVNDVFVVGKNK